MRLIIVVVALAGIASALPSPKVESSIWENLIQIGGDVEIKNHGRSSNNLEETVESYLKDHELSVQVPIIGSTVTLDARNLDTEELDFKLRFNSGSQVEARKKSKLKKIFIPILVFILLKAMTLIPLALGILGLKTWNAIQLSLVSFIAALGMAVYKLCTKVSDHHHHPHIVHEGHFDSHFDHHQYAARADQVVAADAQQLAYNSYAPQN